MNSKTAKKKNRPTKEAAAYLEARAAEAVKQTEAARRLARVAKSRFKDAKKAFKAAKKFAKQARKQAKAASKALKQQQKRGRKPIAKKAAKAKIKSATANIAGRRRKQVKRTKADATIVPQRRPAAAVAETPPNITQA